MKLMAAISPRLSSRLVFIGLLVLIQLGFGALRGLAEDNVGFVKVEDFEALTTGAINGRGGWSASAAIQVVADPADAANRVLRLANGPVEAYKALPNPIASSSTGTLHFRLRRAGQIDGFAGASDLAAPTDWAAFETQLGAQIQRPAETFVARNGSVFNELGAGFGDQTWLCVWLVANNASDRYEVYVKGGALSTATRLESGNLTNFAFRNGGADPLRTFFTRFHQDSVGALFIDDIYVDESAQNLTVPGRDCSSAPPPPPPPSGFQKVEDFNALSTGALAGQNGWSAGSNVQVVVDPVDGANRALQMNSGPVQAFKALPATIPNSNTGTLHFRLRRDGHIDGFAGATDVATPSDWPAFETQFGAQSNHADNEFVARNGAAFTVMGNGFLDRTWLCVWLVTNNSTNSYEAYVAGGNLSQPTKLTGASGVLSFRNGGIDPLTTFFTRFHQSSHGTLWLDDIYVDPSAQNLTIPGKACGESGNQPPTANDDAFSVVRDSLNNDFNVLSNDTTLPDTNETLTLQAVAAPNQGGSARIDSGRILYSPKPGFVGQESFNYTINDGNGGTDTGNVTVSVQAATGINLKVAHIETSQAIQTLNNSVSLIAGRPTVARVYLSVVSSSGVVAGVSARLRATRNGVELAGSPLAPVNPGGVISAKQQPNREVADDTLNFQLPANWLLAGGITLQAEVNPNRAINELDFGDNLSAQFALNFASVRPLELVLIPIAYQKNRQGPIYRPTLNQNNNLGMGMLPRIFPIGEVRHRIHAEYYFGGDLSTNEGWGQLLSEIAQLRQQERPNETFSGGVEGLLPKYYGVLPMEGALWGGMAYLPGTAGIGLVEQDDVAAHELGHNMGLPHVESSVCGANPAGTDPAYPYPNSSIGNPGVDPYSAAVIKLDHRDIMSYCWPKWISDYHYNKLLNVMRAAGSTVLASHSSQPLAEQPALLISGRITADGQSATLNHAVPVTITGELATASDGSYELLLIDGQGNIAHSQSFEPTAIEVVSDTVQPKDFWLTVPRIADLASIELRRAGSVLVTLQASSPVQLSASHSFDANDPKKLLIAWQVAGGAAAQVNLRYSADGGQSWQLIALGQTQSPFTLDTTHIAGSSGGLIDVIASTPTESTSFVLNVGAVVDKAPVVAILGGRAEAFLPNEPIVLLGAAVDYEDGPLSGASLVWLDATGAQVGTGSTLVLAAGLPLGTHHYRLRATDKAGNQVTTDIEIKIGQAVNAAIYLPLVRN